MGAVIHLAAQGLGAVEPMNGAVPPTLPARCFGECLNQAPRVSGNPAAGARMNC